MSELLFWNNITPNLGVFLILFLYSLGENVPPAKLSSVCKSASQKGWKQRAGEWFIDKRSWREVAVFPAETSSPVDELKVRNNDREGMTCQHNATIVGITKAAAEQQG